MRPGVRPLYAREVAAVDAGESTLRVFAATKPVRHRGDTLNAPLITVEVRSPMPDVLAVRLLHHAGERAKTPNFEIETDPATAVEIEDGPEQVRFRSGALELSVNRSGPFTLTYRAGGRVLTTSEPKAVAVLETDHGGHYVREQLTLGVDEHVYGL